MMRTTTTTMIPFLSPPSPPSSVAPNRLAWPNVAKSCSLAARNLTMLPQRCPGRAWPVHHHHRRRYRRADCQRKLYHPSKQKKSSFSRTKRKQITYRLIASSLPPQTPHSTTLATGDQPLQRLGCLVRKAQQTERRVQRRPMSKINDQLVALKFPNMIRFRLQTTGSVGEEGVQQCHEDELEEDEKLEGEDIGPEARLWTRLGHGHWRSGALVERRHSC